MRSATRYLLAVSVVALSLSACSGAPSATAPSGEPTAGTYDGNAPEGITDPQVGWVRVWARTETYTMLKRCDGPTLVYRTGSESYGSIAVVPSSPECSKGPDRR